MTFLGATLSGSRTRGSEPFSRYGDARRSAASVLSLTKSATSSSNDAVGLADATAKILSVKTVLLLGVARWRPRGARLVSNSWACCSCLLPIDRPERADTLGLGAVTRYSDC